MYITITTNAGTQTAEVANTESGLYEEIGKHLLDLPIPNRMIGYYTGRRCRI